ncbi:MAG TPA: nucleotidyltransferase family protein [Vicinamibacterales bacterium]|nr:nucleotidyltransferase family protein [Vicinamibacterales bacterium]
MSPGLSSAERRAEREVVAMLRGETVEPVDAMLFARTAITHRVAALVLRSTAAGRLPADASVALFNSAREQAALTVVRERELRRVVDALASEGVDALLMKGAHLAYAMYPDPVLRPRDDTDLLVRPGQRDTVTRVFQSLGYSPSPAISGAAVHGQTIFDRADIPAGDFDVHWRFAGPPLAADLFDFDALWSRSREVPALSPFARGPGRADAITIAAVHLVAHHRHDQRLLWLYDVYLLVGGLNEDECAAFARHVRDTRMSAICADVIRSVEARFPTERGARLLSGWRDAGDEPSAALLTPRGPLQQVRLDVRATRGWRARGVLLAAHLFPPADYMRTSYAPRSVAPLAWLYARRIISGAVKWFGLFLRR